MFVVIYFIGFKYAVPKHFETLQRLFGKGFLFLERTVVGYTLGSIYITQIAQNHMRDNDVQTHEKFWTLSESKVKFQQFFIG